MEDEKIFDRLESTMRKVLGLEMEAAAIGAIHHVYRLPYDIRWMIVMKGVQDFADHKKNDNFRHFAARASAECLIGFLRENLPPSGPVAGFDDILIHGTKPMPNVSDPSPAMLLDSRHQVVPFYESEGNTGLMIDLENWLSNERAVSVRLLYGAGGIGKTRLMVQWCADLRGRGWIAGFLPEFVPRQWFERICSFLINLRSWLSIMRKAGQTLRSFWDPL